MLEQVTKRATATVTRSWKMLTAFTLLNSFWKNAFSCALLPKRAANWYMRGINFRDSTNIFPSRENISCCREDTPKFSSAFERKFRFYFHDKFHESEFSGFTFPINQRQWRVTVIEVRTGFGNGLFTSSKDYTSTISFIDSSLEFSIHKEQILKICRSYFPWKANVSVTMMSVGLIIQVDHRFIEWKKNPSTIFKIYLLQLADIWCNFWQLSAGILDDLPSSVSVPVHPNHFVNLTHANSALCQLRVL